MNIPKAAIKNYHIVCTVCFILMVASIINFGTTPRTEFPVIDIPMVAVIAQVAGTNVENIETQFLTPIEEALDELDNVEDVRSDITGNMILIDIGFTHGVDVEEKLSQTKSIINFIRKDLPGQLLGLNIYNYATNKASILNLALVSDQLPDAVLENEAKRVQKTIRQVVGVKQVKLDAYAKQEVQIDLDLNKLYAYGITFGEVEQILKSNNAYIPGGDLDVDSKKLNIITTGAIEDVAQLRETFVKHINGRSIRLADLANITLGAEKQDWIIRQNGQPAPIIHVYQESGADVIQVTQKIKEALVLLPLNEQLQVEYVYAQADEVEEQINTFFVNLGQGLLLVCLVLFLVLGFRSAMIIAILIPLASFVGLMCTNVFGLGLNQMAIVGMIVSLGLLVDNSIAIVENIERLLDEGMSKLDACIKGVNQLLYPMTSSTLTTMAVFIPIIFMPDTTGDFIKPMPVVVLFTMLASLLLAIVLAPVLCYFFLGKKEVKPLYKIIKRLEQRYTTLLEGMLQHRKKVLAGTLAVFFGTLMLFPYVGVTFFPKADKQFFLLTVQTEKAKSLEYTDSLVQNLEKILKTKQEIKSYTTSVGHGTPSIYYNMATAMYADNYAEVFIESTLKDKTDFNEFIGSLKEELHTFTKAKISVKEYSQGLPAKFPLEIIVKGDNLEKLEAYSHEIAAVMERTTGVVQIDNSFDHKFLNLKFEVDYQAAARLGVLESQIDKEIQNIYRGSTIGTYINTDHDKQAIKLNYQLAEQEKIEAIKNIRLRTSSGTLVPLGNLVHLKLSNSIHQLSHYNFDRVAMISADVADETKLDAILASLKDELSIMPWEPGYSFSFKGDFENRDESFGQLGYATIIAILIIITILIAQYKSFLIPGIIISILPLTIIGALLALWITGQSFSFTAFIGLISLIGICINDSIILVDFSYELFKDGLSREAAILKAARTRLVPVLMTSITTIFGLFFLALNGGSLWTPMATTIIGGLIGTTFFVLVIIPILFYYLCPYLKPVLKTQYAY